MGQNVPYLCIAMRVTVYITQNCVFCRAVDSNIYCNYSVGLRIHCADRKKVYHGQAKIPSPKAILHGFLPVTVKVLNSYHIF